MTHSTRFLAGAAIMLGAFGSTIPLVARAQGTPQTVTLMRIDQTTLATGYRTSMVVGSTVLNEANETVGTIDDLIITKSDQVPYAVLSVGGFLGMGTRYVVVPANWTPPKTSCLHWTRSDSLLA
jgi:hypothetical protein